MSDIVFGTERIGSWTSPFETAIRSGWTVESGARPGALVFEASPHRVWTSWDRPEAQRSLERFVIPLSGEESGESLQCFVRDHASLIAELLDGTARGQWSAVHEARGRLSRAWSEAEILSEAAVLESNAYKQGSDGRLPPLAEMERYWRLADGRRAFWQGLEEALDEHEPSLVFHEGHGGGEHGNLEDENLASVFESVCERLKAMRRSLFPSGVALSLDELRERHGAIAEEDVRLAARTWALDADLNGKAPPMQLDASSVRALRDGFVERLDEHQETAESLRYAHALAVHADPTAVDFYWKKPMEQVQASVREVDLPERHQNVGRFVQVLFPELVPQLERAGQSIEALNTAVGELQRHWTISEWRETWNLLGALAWGRAMRGEGSAEELRDAVQGIRVTFGSERVASAQRREPWPPPQVRVEPALQAMAKAVARAESDLEAIRSPESWNDQLAPRYELRASLAREWFAACAQALAPESARSLEDVRQNCRAENWVEREHGRASDEWFRSHTGTTVPSWAERESGLYARVIEVLQRSSDADPELSKRALEIAQGHYQRATRSLANEREELDEDLELAV